MGVSIFVCFFHINTVRIVDVNAYVADSNNFSASLCDEASTYGTYVTEALNSYSKVFNV